MDGVTAVQREGQRDGEGQIELEGFCAKWISIYGCLFVAAFSRMLVGGADFGGPDHLANVCMRVCVCLCVCACVCVCSQLCEPLVLPLAPLFSFQPLCSLVFFGVDEFVW